MLSSIKTISGFGVKVGFIGYGGVEAVVDGVAGSIKSAASDSWVEKVDSRTRQENRAASYTATTVAYAATADVTQEYVVDPLKEVAGSFTDLFRNAKDAPKTAPKPNGGLGHFGRK